MVPHESTLSRSFVDGTHANGIPTVPTSTVPKRLEGGGDGRGPWVDMTGAKAGMWESQE